MSQFSCKRGRLLGATLAIVLSACANENETLKQKPISHTKEQELTAAASEKAYSLGEGRIAREKKEIRKADTRRGGSMKKNHEKFTSLDFDFSGFGSTLIGMNVEEITELIGLPAFQRSEPPAQIWQYRSSACVVDIHIYKNKGELTVEYVEARGRKGGNINEKNCFVSVLDKH